MHACDGSFEDDLRWRLRCRQCRFRILPGFHAWLVKAEFIDILGIVCLLTIGNVCPEVLVPLAAKERKQISPRFLDRSGMGGNACDGDCKESPEGNGETEGGKIKGDFNRSSQPIMLCDLCSYRAGCWEDDFRGQT